MFRSLVKSSSSVRAGAARSLHVLARPAVPYAATAVACAAAPRALAAARISLAAPLQARAFSSGSDPVKKCLDDEDLRAALSGAGESLVVVDWYAEWCAPCRRMAPLVEGLAAATPEVTFLKADIDQLEDASVEAGVQSVPTFHFIKNGSLVAEFSGADMNKLKELVAQHK